MRDRWARRVSAAAARANERALRSEHGSRACHRSGRHEHGGAERHQAPWYELVTRSEG